MAASNSGGVCSRSSCITDRAVVLCVVERAKLGCRWPACRDRREPESSQEGARLGASHRPVPGSACKRAAAREGGARMFYRLDMIMLAAGSPARRSRAAPAAGRRGSGSSSGAARQGKGPADSRIAFHRPWPPSCPGCCRMAAHQQRGLHRGVWGGAEAMADESAEVVRSVGLELVSRLAPEELPLYPSLVSQFQGAKRGRGVRRHRMISSWASGPPKP